MSGYKIDALLYNIILKLIMLYSRASKSIVRDVYIGLQKMSKLDK